MSNSTTNEAPIKNNEPAKWYDVELRIVVEGYEKFTTHRVLANGKENAIFEAYCNEAHNLTRDEIIKKAVDAEQGITSAQLEDGDLGDFIYLVEYVNELLEVAIEVDGVSVTALLPSPNDTFTHKYFI